MNKKALITGGSRGIGLGIAIQLAKEGFDVAINGIRPEEKIVDVLENIRQFGVKAIYCQGDICSNSGRDSIINKIKKEFGRLNILVNNAGVAPKERNDILETTEESFEHVLKTNLHGPFFLTQSIAKWFIEQKQADSKYFGAIVNITSISSTVVSTNRSEYCISKAGLGMMSRLFATRLGGFDIPVYEIRPGVIETDMTSGTKEKYDKLFSEGLSVQPRWGQPEDVAKIVLALAKGLLPYSTGTVIMADGGLTIPRL